jgi:hypothetical protein
MLTIGSMSALYKFSFLTHKGDYVYLLISSLVLSRHLLYRLWCTWSPSTHASPTLVGIVSHFLQSHVAGGQVFDRPPALPQFHPSGDARSTGGTGSVSTLQNPSAVDRMLQKTAHSVVLDSKTTMSISQLIPSIFIYAWQLPRRYIVFPTTQTISKFSLFRREFDGSSSRDEQRQYDPRHAESTRSQWIRGLRKMAMQFWVLHGPSLQFLLTAVLFLYYLNLFHEYRKGRSIYDSFFSAEPRLGLLAVNSKPSTMTEAASDRERQRYSRVYNKLRQPATMEVFALMLSAATFFSLVVFSRIMLPLADLVAGGQTIKDLRTEARAASMMNATTSSSYISTGFSSFMSNMRDFISFTANPLASETAPWTERQHTITAENRLQLALSAAFVRLIENVVVVGIFPRTSYVCRFTGHCPPGLPLWDTTAMANPTRLNDARRHLPSGLFGIYMETDIPSAITALFGVIVVSITLLGAQMILLDRTYVSILGYLSGEWEFADDVKDKTLEPHQQPTSLIPQPKPWDPRRKYKKDDLVVYPHHGGTIFRATVNAPEGRPHDLRSLATCSKDYMCHELGSPVTSKTILIFASVQGFVACLYFVAWAWVGLKDSKNTTGFIWVVGSHVLAAEGVLSIIPGSRAHFSVNDELRNLNADIINNVDIK